MGLIPEPLLNNTVILIHVTSIYSSYITQKAGKKLLFEEVESPADNSKVKQKILVPVANPLNMENLLEFASLIKREDNNIPVYPLTIFTNRKEVRDKINKNQQKILEVIDSLQSDVSFETSLCIDTNVTNGIVHEAEEVVATTIVMGWNNRNTPFHVLFGNVLNNLLEKTERMLLVLKTPSGFRQVRKILLFCAENAQYEKGFYLWLDTLVHLIKRLQLKTIMYCESGLTLDAIKHYYTRTNTAKYFELIESG